MKTEVVRIATSRIEKLKMLSDLTGHSVTWMLNRAIDAFLDVEGPVWEEMAKEARSKIASRRQAVRSEVA